MCRAVEECVASFAAHLPLFKCAAVLNNIGLKYRCIIVSFLKRKSKQIEVHVFALCPVDVIYEYWVNAHSASVFFFFCLKNAALRCHHHVDYSSNCLKPYAHVLYSNILL